LDIDETTNPVEAELSWVISKGKTGYVGEEAIARYRMTPPVRSRRGIMMAEGIPRHGFTVTDVSSRRIGEITSGTFSPLLRKGIGIGYISTPDSQLGTTVQVLIRGSPNQGKIVKPPFYDETAYGWKRASSKDNSLTNPKLAP